jgi:hypothetical protein
MNHHTIKKGTQVSYPRHILTSLLHRFGVAGFACLRALRGSGAFKILVAVVGLKAFGKIYSQRYPYISRVRLAV